MPVRAVETITTSRMTILSRKSDPGNAGKTEQQFSFHGNLNLRSVTVAIRRTNAEALAENLLYRWIW
jgi:hypothetical protein